MRNEFDKPTQGFAQRAPRIYYYIIVAIELTRNRKGFSDSSMKKRLGYSMNTIRSIREQLEEKNLVVPYLKDTNHPNNEKFYRVIHIREAEQFASDCYSILRSKIKREISAGI